MSSKERKAIDRANDASARKMKREESIRKEAPTLPISKKIRFLDMLKRGATSHEFKSKLQLEPSEVASLKSELGVVTQGDISARLRTLEREMYQERQRNAERVKSFPEVANHKKEKKEKEQNDSMIMKKNVPDMGAVTRRRRIKSILAAVENLEDADLRDWQVPIQDEKTFCLKIHYGTTYWSDHYCVPRSIIRKEILRLMPDVDLDAMN